MLLGDYIHWQLDNQELSEAGRYFSQKQENINAVRYNTYRNMILSKFQNEQSMNSYLELVKRIIGNNQFQKSVNEAVEKLAFPTLSSGSLNSEEIQTKLKENSEEFQRLAAEIKTALNGIIHIMENEDLVGVNKETRLLMKELGINNEGAFLNIREHEKDARVLKGQYKWLLSQLHDFQDAISSGTVDETSLKIIQRFLTPIQTLIGLGSEYIVTNEINKITDQLSQELNQNTKISAKQIGETSDGAFKFQTADIALSFSPGNDEKQINVNIPNLGISLKRSRANLNKTSQVKLGSLKRSSYGKLLQEVSQGMKTAFYNLYAYVHQEKKNEVDKILDNAYSTMKMYASITALVGSLNVENLVFVLIVNNKAITIFDLLESMKGSEENLFSLIPDFENKRNFIINKHKQFWSKTPRGKMGRSKKIRNAIDAISARISLTLAEAQIRRMI